MSFYSKIVDELNAAVQTKDAAKVALAARDAGRSAVKFLFEKKGIEWDEKATLLELVHSRTVEEFVAVPEQVAALDFVRMLGGNAEHGVHVKKTQAARAEKTARDFAAALAEKWNKSYPEYSFEVGCFQDIASGFPTKPFRF